MLSSQRNITPAVFLPGKSCKSVNTVPYLVKQIGGVLPDSRSQWESERGEEAKAQDTGSPSDLLPSPAESS